MQSGTVPVVLELLDICKSFGDNRVLNDFCLTVHEGEFVTLLGSSGCGKTTLMRIVAGLEPPTSGRVLLEGADMEGVGPEKRNINMVFQNYALFPHMNVFQNIAYGPKLKKLGKAEIAARVDEMLRLVQMQGFEKRMPSEMSGGQRQRIAIARALINNPRVLLLDEPLGALDLQLRRQMQHELKNLQKELGITFLYITHDQEEALNMSDRIVVMKDGRIEQEGSPAEIYDHPRTSFVARFVGSANVLQGTVKEIAEEALLLETPFGCFPCSRDGMAAAVGESVTAAVRGENIAILAEATAPCHLTGVVKEKTFAGGMLRIVVKLGEETEMVISRQGINIEYAIGEQVALEWPACHCVPVDRGDGR